MANVAINNITDTWNSSGTTFTGIKFNVTDTSSAAASLLMDLQVGGVSKFKVNKAGKVDATVFYGNLYGYINTSEPARYQISSSGISLGWDLYLGWTNNWAGSAVIVKLEQDGNNTLAQRNGVNAQTNRLYGTYTDASNYRRLTKTMSAAGVAEIKPEGGGTGATGNVLHISGLPTANPGPGILWNNAGVVNVGT